MVAAFHRHDLAAAREAARGRERHHVGFGARIGEAHQIQIEAPGDGLREGHFATVAGAEIDPGLQRFRDGCLDARMRVPIDAGRILAQQIDIVMSVHIGDPGPFGPGHTDRERRGEEDGTCIATRHDPGGAILHRLRIWMSGHIAGNGLGQGVVQAVGPVPVHQALCPPMGGVNCSPMSQGR